MTNAEIWMICLTAVIAVGGIIGACIFNNQLSVMQGQLAEMKTASRIAENTLIAGQRAWIRAEVTLGDQPLTIDHNGISTAVSFKITNVGNTPAIHIVPHAWLFVPKSGGPFPLEEQESRCGEVRRQALGGGFTLFPGETFPSSIGIGTWSLQLNISKDDIDKLRASTPNGGAILLSVVGCIDYTFPIDQNTHHQTGFIYEFRKTGPSMISLDEGAIPVGNFYLQDSGLGNSRYAD
jgi:hypothetical protein